MPDYYDSSSVIPAIAQAMSSKDQRNALIEYFKRQGMGRQQLIPQNIGVILGFSERIPRFNETMETTANSTARGSEAYNRHGVYDEVANFISVSSSDLVLDTACGTSHLFAVIKAKNALGIDVNPYVLDMAEIVLKDANIAVVNHRNPTLEFDARRGLYPTGRHLQQELDTDSVNLYCDNAMQLEVSREALSRLGDKATVLVSILPDVLGAHYNLEHIARDTNARYKTDPLYVTTGLIRNSQKVLDPNGRLVLGIRITEDYAETAIKTLEQSVGRIVSITEQKTLDLPSEAQGGYKSGLLNAGPSGQLYVPSHQQYKLLMLEAKLK